MVPVYRDAEADDPRAIVTGCQNAISSIPRIGIPKPKHLDRQCFGVGIPGAYLTRRSARSEANWRDTTMAWRRCASLLFGCGQRLRQVYLCSSASP